MQPISILRACLFLAAGAAGLVGCAITNLEDVEPTGSRFTRALTEQYKELAALETGKSYDHGDAEFYARKARAAANGDPIVPSDPRNWNLRQAHLDQLLPAHAALIWALDNLGRIRAPEAAARAQAGFDCWVERAEDDLDADLIRACRDRFREGYTVTRNAIQ